MAATYDETEPTAKDRVRGLMGDVAAPFRFTDERIQAYLDRQAVGEAGEITVAIQLLESLPTTSGDETTIRTLSVTRTNKGGKGDFTSVLVNLRRRLLMLRRAGGGFVSVVQPNFTETQRRNGWGGR